MSFTDKVALVTGGGAGIGGAVSQLLAARGAAVVVSDISEEFGAETVKTITENGGKAAFIRTDVTKSEDLDAAVAFAVETFGGLHLAMNNAGGGSPDLAPLDEISVERYEKTIALSQTSMFYSLKAELAWMKFNGGGAIVNMASDSGLGPTAGRSDYSTAKHAVIGLTRNAAVEYASMGIRVNAVAPGPIATAALASLDEESLKLYTSNVAMGRFGKPEEVAALAAFLLSDDASYITGVTVPVNGGNANR